MKNKLTQEQVWDKVARPWRKFRGKPVLEVREFLKSKQGRVLDLGCGSGRHLCKIKGVIYGVDFSEKMLKLAEQDAKKREINAVFIKAEAENLPFEDDFFDAAIFIASLHNLETPEKRKKALQELFRVLKPEAEAMISVVSRAQKRFKNKPKSFFLPWTVNDKKYLRYYYLYDKQELLDLLKETGFQILEILEEKKGNYAENNIILIIRKP